MFFFHKRTDFYLPIEGAKLHNADQLGLFLRDWDMGVGCSY